MEENIKPEDEQELLFENNEEIGSEDEEDIVQDDGLFSRAVIWGTDWTSETVNSQFLCKKDDKENTPSCKVGFVY